jgi:hypothetical protein
MKSRTRVSLGAVLALTWAVAQADAPARPLVVELFTAQGCSSCPPADAFLGQLSQRPDVLALAFHVDYWDSGGWRDRFELRQAVDRQNVYVINFRRSSAFTPQFVIDGRKDAVSPSAIAEALQEPREAVPVTLAVHDGEVVVDIGEKPGAHPSEVMLVAYLRHASTSVGRGENGGKTLEEFNIVRSIGTLGAWQGTAKHFEAKVASLPSDATDVAVLVQGHREGPIVGAATQSLH